MINPTELLSDNAQFEFKVMSDDFAFNSSLNEVAAFFNELGNEGWLPILAVGNIVLMTRVKRPVEETESVEANK